MTHRSILAPILLAAVVAASSSGCAWIESFTTSRRNEAQRLAEIARQAEIDGNPDQAESLLERAAGIRPDDAELYRHLARLAWNRSDFAAAAENYRRVVALAPDDVEAWRRLGSSQARLGDFDAARESVEQALKHDPHDVPSILLESRLADRRGDTAAALNACHRALRIEPENVEARLRLAEVHLRESRADLAAPLLRAICDDSDVDGESRSRAAWGLGIAYGMQRRWSDSAEALKESLAHRQHTTADQWHRLAYAHLQAGDRRAAGEALDEAFRRDPQHAGAHALAAAIGMGRPGQTGAIAAVGHVEPVAAPFADEW